MAKFKLVVFTDAVSGKEDEYNDWYNNIHLQDVTAVPGFVAAQRFRLRTLVAGEFQNKYLAIYDMEGDNPEEIMARVGERSGTDRMFITDALDLTANNVAIFEPCSEIVAGPTTLPAR